MLLHSNLPKSTSSLLSELHLPITQNMTYQDSISNPVTRMLGSFWDISTSSPTNPGNQKFTWSLPCRIHDGPFGTLRSGKNKSWRQNPNDYSTKLSVKEQARQFEQQELAYKTS